MRGGFGGNGSIAWTSAVSHVGRTSNAFKVTMKLQTFLFQMVVTSCISVRYLWKCGFAKYSDNLYAPCVSYIFSRFQRCMFRCSLWHIICDPFPVGPQWRQPWSMPSHSWANKFQSHWCSVGLFHQRTLRFIVMKLKWSEWNQFHSYPGATNWHNTHAI
jgi:hypothetical protein